MNDYPLLQEYIEAIKFAEDNFEALKLLRPVLGEDGEPIMSSGNFAVVFKMKNVLTDKFYAIKCFLRDQEGREEAYRMISEVLSDVNSSYITPITYIENELFVDSKATDETEFPVLLMDWVEGKTLDKYIRENLDDQYALEMLAYQFSCLAVWLLPQPFAHGDLKPDNIIVREDGTLTLVDYDGMYVPAMKGQMARELGSPGFRHPSRMVEEFNEHIDDFPIASILLSLKAIALQPTLLEEYGASDRLLLSEEDYRNISQSQFFKQVFPSDNMELNKLMNLFMLALSENNLSGVSSSLFNLQKPEEPEVEVYSTEVTEEDFDEVFIDEHNAKYSNNGIRFLRFYEGLPLISSKESNYYSIKEGTKVLCDRSFSGIISLKEIEIPSSTLLIGRDAFYACISLKSVRIPNSVVSIGSSAFEKCTSLCSVAISNSLNEIEEDLFRQCDNLVNVKFPNLLMRIGSRAFKGCISLPELTIPSVVSIDEYSFDYCISLENIKILHSLKKIGKFSFYRCKSLVSISLPDSLEMIDSCAFKDCFSLRGVDLSKSVSYLGESVFSGCKSLTQVNIARTSRIKSIPVGTFSGCECLTSLIVPNYVTDIDSVAFQGCVNLESIILPNSLNTIKSGAFRNCKKLKSIVIPQSVTTIWDKAFEGCESLETIIIPNSVVVIGDEAFRDCCSLTKVIISDSVKYIGDLAFAGCELLKPINIPDTVKYIGIDLYNYNREYRRYYGNSFFKTKNAVFRYIEFPKMTKKEIEDQIKSYLPTSLLTK